MFRVSLPVALLLAALGCGCGDSAGSGGGAGAVPAIVPVPPGKVGDTVLRFENGEIVEASGVQRSQRLPGLFWVHNDSGAGPYLYATDAAGRDLGRIELAGAQFSDFEDIGGFQRNGISYLVVGDIGDNAESRASLQLYVLAEPPLEQLPPRFRWQASDYVRIEVSYDDGLGHDCESMAIDPVRDEVLLVTKSFTANGAQELWTGRLSTALATGALSLQRQTAVHGISVLPPAVDGQLLSTLAGTATTAMDLSPNLDEVAILTYGRIYVWRRESEDSWAQALAQAPTHTFSTPAAGNNQAEGLGYSGDGRWLLVSAENSLPSRVSEPGGSTLSLVAR